MFGSISWFTPVTAQMFVSIWGREVGVRVGASEATRLISAGKAEHFKSVWGHTMKEYVFVPAADAADDRKLAAWVVRSADYSLKLPPKKK